MKKTNSDLGWEFLFNEDKKQGYYCDEEGNEWNIYSDGSGFFNGIDGSEGWIYSDGSGYYNGADGSEGYKYSDGSGYFNGTDGSDGYKYSDGSGYYYSNTTGKTEYIDPQEKQQTQNNIISDISELIVNGITLATIYGQKLEHEERLRKEKIKQKRKAKICKFCKRNSKEISITVSCLIIFLFLGFIIISISNLIPIGYSSSALKGEKYTTVVKKLEEAGFTNIKLKEIPDLPLSRKDEHEKVSEIEKLFSDEFNAKTQYPYNFKITVVYHTIKLNRAPITSKKSKGMNYKEVTKLFETSGFSNIKYNIKYDIITGWIKADGEVDYIEINGNKKYDGYDEFRPDAEVVITYHTLKKNKKK